MHAETGVLINGMIYKNLDLFLKSSFWKEGKHHSGENLLLALPMVGGVPGRMPLIQLFVPQRLRLI